ncbi:MAG: 2-oxo acid dehydrogenase subunit E2 [Chloroflexaceae bacterium]|jgi:pyruvate dehydrogenase E2 component (dihydrolipoamide acetyltransferase)|nr:2-oxo acid dehydrogenase subunit E2 [Chloroflexaceae bacterium]
MIEVILPKVDMAMSEGTIATWLRNEGEAVKEGEALFEVETDKANVEVEAPASGILWGIRARPGDTVPIAQVVAYILAPGEQPPSPVGSWQSAVGNSQLAVSSSQSPVGSSQSAVRSSQFAGDGITEDPNSQLSTLNSQFSTRLRATPAARKLSRERGVHLAQVRGTGPSGRIGRGDVLAFLEQHLNAETQRRRDAEVLTGDRRPETGAAPTGDGRPETGAEQQGGRRETGAEQQGGRRETGDGKLQTANGSLQNGDTNRQSSIANRQSPIANRQSPDEVTRIPHSSLRRVIASRMTASVRNAPHFTLNMQVDMAEALELRRRVSASIEKQVGAKPSVTALLVRALGPLLLNHPMLNAIWDEDAILQHRRAHIGVALDRNGDLLVPVIRDAQTLTLAQVTAALRDLSERAYARKLDPTELRGSTFSLSNLGMFGIDSFTAIINPPEAAILAVGRIVETPVVRDGAVVVRPLMQLTLSADHRVVDGATAARFLADLRERLENPYLLI